MLNILQLLENVKKMIKSKKTGGKEVENEEEEEKEGSGAAKQSATLGPFAFDIDDEIDSEILTSEEVYKDLKELEGILSKNEVKPQFLFRLGRSKKKSKKYYVREKD